jgi:hypothetical protein
VIADSPQLKPNLWAHHSVELYSDGSWWVVGGLQRAAMETTAAELAKLLYWLMVVAYSIRSIEVRYDMERMHGMPPKLAELPPDETT